MNDNKELSLSNLSMSKNVDTSDLMERDNIWKNDSVQIKHEKMIPDESFEKKVRYLNQNQITKQQIKSEIKEKTVNNTREITVINNNNLSAKVKPSLQINIKNVFF